MFSSAEKTNRTTTAVQQKAQQQTFFRKAGEESFFGSKEQPGFFNAPVQAKLSVSSPDDPQEKEADAVAETVMRMPAPVSDTISTENEKKIDKKEDDELQAKSESPTFSKIQTSSLHGIGHVNTSASLFRNTDNEPRHANEEDNNITSGYINRKATGPYHSDTIQRSGRGPPANDIQFAQSLTSSKGAGSPLPGKTREFMESRFNADFGGVRIHTGPQADSMNKSIQAKAFAHGNDIYFKQGQHDPESPEGAKLLAHELTHTIQQGASPQTLKNSNTTANPGQPANQPANDKAALVPAAPSANKANQPGTPQNDSSNQPESESPVTDDLPNHGQLAEPGNAASEHGAPIDTGTPPGAGDNNQPGSSSSKNHTAQTKQAHGAHPRGNRKAVGNTPKAGGSGEREASAANAAAINDRINGAKASAVKTGAVIQAAVINQDYFNTETRLDNISTIRKEQIRNIFIEAHANLDAFFIRSMATLTGSIVAAQMTLIGQVNATLGAVQAFVNTMAALAFALVINTIAFVTTLVANTLAAIARTINMISSRVTSLVNSVNLPDLPGAATIRDYIRNSIYGVSRLIMVALRSVQALIASALTVALRFLTGLIQTIRRAVSNIISNIALILTRIINMIAAAFQGILRVAVITLQNLLNNSIHPMLVNIEAMIMGTIDTLHQKALQDAMENREQALEALAGMIGAQSGGTAPGTGKPMTAAEALAAVALISKQAIDRNQEIVDRFGEDTGILVGILRQRSMVFMALVLAAIIGAMAAIMIKVMQLITLINQAIAALAARIIAGFISFVAGIISGIATFVTSVGAFISHPYLTVVAFVQSVINIIVSFIANMIRRFISGLFGGNSQQAPPAVQPHAVGTGGAVPVPVISPATLIGNIRSAIISAFTTIGMAILWGFAAVITFLVQTVVLAITIGIAALLRVFLMWRFITAPGPKPYPKPSPNLTITHETKFAAPDGSANTRSKVGVGEEVEFTANAVGDWSASGGTPLVLAGNDKFKWTAPERENTITVTFSDGIKTVSEVMEVIEPKTVTGTRKSVLSFPPGQHGVGMKLLLHYHPDQVSFGNIDVKEVSGGATNISGYFLTHPPPFHNSGDAFLDVKQNNDDSALDTASLFKYKPQWSEGAFDWSIPYHFKVRSEAGEKKFTDVVQAFKMFDATGKTEITKGGAQVDRTP